MLCYICGGDIVSQDGTVDLVNGHHEWRHVSRELCDEHLRITAGDGSDYKAILKEILKTKGYDWDRVDDIRVVRGALTIRMKPEVRDITLTIVSESAEDTSKTGSCTACGKPFSPSHDASAPGPTVRHPFMSTFKQGGVR